jgi:hypothetical protein
LDILSFKHLKEDHDMKHLQCEYSKGLLLYSRNVFRMLLVISYVI